MDAGNAVGGVPAFDESGVGPIGETLFKADNLGGISEDPEDGAGVPELGIEDPFGETQDFTDIREQLINVGRRNKFSSGERVDDARSDGGGGAREGDILHDKRDAAGVQEEREQAAGESLTHDVDWLRDEGWA